MILLQRRAAAYATNAKFPGTKNGRRSIFMTNSQQKTRPGMKR